MSYRIYQAYVIPRLLFNLETLHLNITQLNQLQRFHISNLRNFQSLPVRTASSAVQLLLGALPIQAEIHRRQLNLIHSIVQSSNTSIQDVMYRQMALGSSERFSVQHRTLWICMISRTYQFYQHLRSSTGGIRVGKLCPHTSRRG